MTRNNAGGRFRLLAALSVFATTALTPVLAQAGTASVAKDDATVVAVIDTGFSPYHQDFLQSQGNPYVRSLPLTKAPDTWLSGFPKPSTFASYKPLRLTLDGTNGANMSSLHAKDANQWNSVLPSTASSIHYRWIPGTKVIGALTFGPEPTDRAIDQLTPATAATIYGAGGSDHGMGTTSVAVGNRHGTCPSCVLVFIQYTDQESAERALTWVHNQPWIDAVSNSYGFSTGVALRDRVYNDTDLAAERAASERGQTTFFSAGNGLENAFTVPNSTLTSSQEGPDWVVTVAAVDPAGRDFSGTGKPADIAGMGMNYPSAYDSSTVSNGDAFSGTSNATAQIAGTYAQALFQARRALVGRSRVQHGGIVALGGPFSCGRKRRSCELADGTLTATELRTALFMGATPTAGHYTDGVASAAQSPALADTRFASEGYGAYRGRFGRAYDAEMAKRLMGPLMGRVESPSRPTGEILWFRTDSWCRQHIWGRWAYGSFVNNNMTPLPDPDTAWPTRTAILSSCQGMMEPPSPILTDRTSA